MQVHETVVTWTPSTAQMRRLHKRNWTPLHLKRYRGKIGENSARTLLRQCSRLPILSARPPRSYRAAEVRCFAGHC